MEIFKIVGDDGFNVVSPVGEDYSVSMFDGTPLADDWHPIDIEVVRPEDGCEDSDCPHWFPGVLVFSERAWKQMSGCVGSDEVEVLPLRTKPNRHGFEYDYCLVNVIKVVECLDQKRSQVTRYPSSGRIMRIDRYAFDINKLEGVSVFKIPEQLTTAIFVTGPFVQRYRSTELEGLAFERVFPVAQEKRSGWKFWRR